MTAPRVAIVGGGIAGLAAALRLRDRLPQASISVYDQAPRLGGKLRTGELSGRGVEMGAESFLVRDPAGGDSAAVSLVRRVGLGEALVHPDPVPAGVVVGGELRPLPGGTLLGVPSDLSTLDGVAEAVADRDRDEGRPLLGPDEDPAVGALVRARLGDEVVDRLVDPLLGGVYAGRADGLSLAATMPALAAAARKESTLVGATKVAVSSSATHSGGPVFGTVQGGLTRLVDGVVAAVGPVTVRLAQPIRELRPVGSAWRLVTGTAPAPLTDEADAVVLALPATRAARLLGVASPVDYASVVLVTLVLPVVELPELSGFLVPASEGRAVKAVTFFTRKWGHLRFRDGRMIVRASLGRYGETAVLQRKDASLVDLVRAELAALLGRSLPAPTEASVTRWGGGLPQYAPGHLDRVARMRAALPAGVALAGAGYDGVGIPACIRSGQAAADEILRQFAV
jgi:oxygen-dependent protoporphyrinogen oxidase